MQLPLTAGVQNITFVHKTVYRRLEFITSDESVGGVGGTSVRTQKTPFGLAALCQYAETWFGTMQ